MFSKWVNDRRLRTLDDVLRAGLFLEVTCRGCGRRSVFASGGFFGLVSSATRLNRLAARMKCEGTPNAGKGCGHRGSEINAISWPPVKPAPAPPKPVASLAPRGVDQAEWDNADDRARKWLVRNARG